MITRQEDCKKHDYTAMTWEGALLHGEDMVRSRVTRQEHEGAILPGRNNVRQMITRKEHGYTTDFFNDNTDFYYILQISLA